MGLTIKDTSTYGATIEVIMMLLGHHTFLWGDGAGGWLEGVSLKLFTWVKGVVPFCDSFLVGKRTLLMDLSLYNLDIMSKFSMYIKDSGRYLKLYYEGSGGYEVAQVCL